MTEQMPAWAETYAQECRDLFGLGEWDIRLRLHDSPGTNGKSDGCVDLETRYLTATIQMRRGLSEQRGRVVILHELLHVVLAHLTHIAEEAIGQLPEPARAMALTFLRDAEEQTIVRLVKSLQTHIKPSAQEVPSDG